MAEKLDDEVTDKFLEVARKLARATTRRLEMQGLKVKYESSEQS